MSGFADLIEDMAIDDLEEPNHYLGEGVECIDAIKSMLGPDFTFYCRGNVMKYIWRYPYKGGIGDLLKAADYLLWLIREEIINDTEDAEIEAYLADKFESMKDFFKDVYKEFYKTEVKVLDRDEVPEKVIDDLIEGLTEIKRQKKSDGCLTEEEVKEAKDFAHREYDKEESDTSGYVFTGEFEDVAKNNSVLAEKKYLAGRRTEDENGTYKEH